MKLHFTFHPFVDAHGGQAVADGSILRMPDGATVKGNFCYNPHSDPRQRTQDVRRFHQLVAEKAEEFARRIRLVTGPEAGWARADWSTDWRTFLTEAAGRCPIFTAPVPDDVEAALARLDAVAAHHQAEVARLDQELAPYWDRPAEGTRDIAAEVRRRGYAPALDE